MSKKSVSVLVPAYNAEKYLPRCLDSILAGSSNDFEVILVDDGSTDNTGNICDTYAKRDSRIKTFHQKNKGISATRNICLRYASGDYISFVDADDFIDAEGLNSLVSFLRKNKYEVAVSPFVFHQKKQCRLISGELTEDAVKRQYVKGYWATLWRLCFAQHCVEKYGLLFPEGINGGEDYFFSNKLLVSTANFFVAERAYYHYDYSNVDSFTHKLSIEKIDYQIQTTEMFEEILKKKGCEKAYIEELNRRKFFAKYDLLFLDKKKWKLIFPEVNDSYGLFLSGASKYIFFLQKNDYVLFSRLLRNILRIMKYAKNLFV